MTERPPNEVAAALRHELVGGRLRIEDTPDGKATAGVIGRCTCGWTTGYRISSFAASNAFRDHKEGQSDG